jgi:hypothetical protein
LGASQFLNYDGKFSLAPGFSPVMLVEKTSESRFNGFGVQGNPLKRVLFS